MKEYLASLMPLLRGETVHSRRASASPPTPSPRSTSPDVEPPPVLVAALGATMLKLAGTRRRRHHHLDDRHRRPSGATSRPTITAAAEAAGRPAPRVVVSLPIAVTADADAAKERINEAFCHLPEPALLQGHAGQGGRRGGRRTSASSVTRRRWPRRSRRLADAGATDFVAAVVGDADERDRGLALLSELARS